ncbi:hypothetical protein Sjap_009600 [Stephania japonica]|uniref:Uncharacterized protein n=1 Tax=Stephania japonica TaxID=461633 RepID=A0AAP0JS92_9MAGN
MIEKVPDSTTTIRRYAPPNQRNRLLSRRKSGAERFDRPNILYGNEADKSQVFASRPLTLTDHGEVGSSTIVNHTSRPGLITIDGCCSSEAAQLLSNDSIILNLSFLLLCFVAAERPVMYSGATAAAWGHSRLPHQMDFLAQLRRAISNANASVDT